MDDSDIFENFLSQIEGTFEKAWEDDDYAMKAYEDEEGNVVTAFEEDQADIAGDIIDAFYNDELSLDEMVELFEDMSPDPDDE